MSRVGDGTREGLPFPVRMLARVAWPTGRVAVLVWTCTIVAFVAVLALTLAIPVSPQIALPIPVAGLDPVLLGVGVWILVGLATSARGTAEEGRVTIVFGVAPVVAALALGGPTAAVWVALLGSFELRELRGSVPWYGVVANHAMLAMSAALGGVLTLWLRGLFADDSQLLDFAHVMAGAAAFCVANVGLSILTVWTRTGRAPREALGIPWKTIGTMMTAESALAWVFAAAYVSVAWWSPAVLVIADAAAAASLDRGRAGWLLRHHQLTQLPNRLSLTEHAADLRRARRSGACVFYIDLDGFKAVNDSYDHSVGDDVLLAVGRRLAASKRHDDFLAHLHGDEFVLLASGVESDADARLIVERIVRSVEDPIDHPEGEIRVSASVGYTLLTDPGDLDEAVRRADRRMAAAKQARATASGRRRRAS